MWLAGLAERGDEEGGEGVGDGWWRIGVLIERRDSGSMSALSRMGGGDSASALTSGVESVTEGEGWEGSTKVVDWSMS